MYKLVSISHNFSTIYIHFSYTGNKLKHNLTVNTVNATTVKDLTIEYNFQ